MEITELFEKLGKELKDAIDDSVQEAVPSNDSIGDIVDECLNMRDVLSHDDLPDFEDFAKQDDVEDLEKNLEHALSVIDEQDKRISDLETNMVVCLEMLKRFQYSSGCERKQSSADAPGSEKTSGTNGGWPSGTAKPLL